jgi:uncharacterized protein (DUF952 family)
LLLRRDWEGSSTDPIALPGGEAFVHCREEHQIDGVRKRYFPADEEVVSLAFDPTQLPVETRYEPGTGGEPERFPHVYGTLPRAAVVLVRGA